MLLKFSHTLEILKIICALHISHRKWQQKLINSSHKEIQVEIIFIPPAFCSARWCDAGEWNNSWNPRYVSLYLCFTDTTQVSQLCFPCCYAHSSAKMLQLRTRSFVSTSYGSAFLLRDLDGYALPRWVSVKPRMRRQGGKSKTSVLKTGIKEENIALGWEERRGNEKNTPKASGCV